MNREDIEFYKVVALLRANPNMTNLEATNIVRAAPYPFCHHPEKCTHGRCMAEFCCAD